MTKKILFICTHNRCRSILAEAIANHFGEGRLIAKSAGSQPVGKVHPLSLKYLQQNSINTDGLCSQSWDDHEDWNPDVVITVCNAAAGEACPLWFGKSLKAHWGLADPSAVGRPDAEIRQAFQKTIDILKQRIEQLLDHQFEKMDNDSFLELINNLGE